MQISSLCSRRLGYVIPPDISVREGMGKQIRNTERTGLEGHCSMGLPRSATPNTENKNLLDLLSPEDEAAAALGSFTGMASP